jgi:acetylornithine aminotransferase
MATLAATGNASIQKGFEPLMPGFVRAPYDDIKAVRKLAANTPSIVAVLVEPVQGEGGVRIASLEYLRALRAVCDEHGWLMMIDEVQTGMGRTGAWFAFQHAGIMPDVITLAKGLGNGFPIGACLARGEAAKLFSPGSHGTTFGGNPLASRVGCAVVDTMEQENFPARAAELGARLLLGLRKALEGAPYVQSIRGHGMMVGVEMKFPCAWLVPADHGHARKDDPPVAGAGVQRVGNRRYRGAGAPPDPGPECRPSQLSIDIMRVFG